ncbi:site-specific DNA-methyltransferase [Thermoplasma sp. Kam2015]|uniref:site-specific DNA-methyltransferase n=1 Tax=Thermoplasma sp. Kam2015 TaxID=2094122 RepID=UPI000DA0F13F|nr:site-specific DNA-methyltransferase [Thermoplasma sp. Kam2015]PYB67517.1 site-specific DNA-methyltransferase [Thermoplasma sp. Kam2015]
MKDFGIYWKNKREEVERVELPFQKIETINLPRSNIGTLAQFRDKTENNEWKNRLIWGDNKYVMASLLTEFRGKIKLIYADPPFFTGTNMNITLAVGDEGAVKEPSAIEEIAYRNMWKEGPSSFFQYMYDRFVLMKDLLSDDGSIWVRFDYHYSHYIKAILDEIFGYENFRNELIVNRTRKNVMASRTQIVFPTATDSLFFYAKSETTLLNQTKIRKSEERKGYWRHMDDSAGQGSAKMFFGRSIEPPPGKHWKFSQENIDKMIREGKLRLNPKTGRPEYWVEPTDEYLLDTNWTDIPGYSFSTGYPTENAEQLLERVILSASNPGDLVADFFAGSGTTAAVAEKLGRRWIVADIGRFSIHTIRKRLLDIPNCKPFEVLNLGKYERKYWMDQNLGSVYRNYIDFILQLYKAKPVYDYKNIHGIISGKAVHVGPIDYPVTKGEVEECLKEAKGNGFSSLDVLGWDFEMEFNDKILKELKETYDFDLSLRIIPNEVMDKRAVDAGDVDFFEHAFLDVSLSVNDRKVRVKLNNFIIPNPESIPEELRDKMLKWSDFIDYWSVDWNYREDTFHNEWQEFRTRQKKNLQLQSIEHTYDEPGIYKIVVKVIDVFGNDTTTVKEVRIE